jgi:hypothetical protein
MGDKMKGELQYGRESMCKFYREMPDSDGSAADNWQTVPDTFSLMVIFNLDKMKLYNRATLVHCVIFKNVFTSAHDSQNEAFSDR